MTRPMRVSANRYAGGCINRPQKEIVAKRSGEFHRCVLANGPRVFGRPQAKEVFAMYFSRMAARRNEDVAWTLPQRSVGDPRPSYSPTHVQSLLGRSASLSNRGRHFFRLGASTRPAPARMPDGPQGGNRPATGCEFGV